MSHRFIRFFFICAVCALALYFSIRLGKEVRQYFLLKNETPARIVQWDVIEVKDRFAIKAKFQFEAQNQTWEQSTLLSPPYYLNEFSAVSSLKKLAKQNWVAWYNPANPQRASLEKKFPYGLLFRTVICYGVLIYFFYLYKRLSRL